MLKRFVLAGVTGLTLTATGLAQSVAAATISFDGLSYESVNWSVANVITNTATGTIGSNTANLTTPNLNSGTIFAEDFSTDPAFDALSFDGSGILESLNIAGGALGETTFEFDREVSSLLVFVGLPNEDQPGNQMGAGVWDFSDALDLTFVDGEVIGQSFLTIGPGNTVMNNAGGAHVSGVFRVDGNFTSVSFTQSTTAGTDLTNITVAASFAQSVPEPVSLLGLLAMSALGAASLKRKQQ